MRLLLSALLFFCVVMGAWAQNAPLAKFKMDDALKAYENKDYPTTLIHLDEAEKAQGQVTQELLYLRVMSQHGIVNKDPLKDFQLLMSLKENSKFYLDNYKNIPQNENRYQQVFLVWDKFGKSYPADKEAFDRAVINAEVRRAQREKGNRIREKAQQREEERKIRNEEFQKIKKQRTFGYVAIRAGLAVPLNAEAKSMVTVEEFENAGGFTGPFRQGRFGLKSGFSVGITGLIPLEFINRDIQEGSLHPKFGFGLSADLTQTWLRYDWKGLDTPDNDSYFLFREAEYKNFTVTSIGFGPAFCFRPTEKRMFFDLFVRPDINLIRGGRYYVKAQLPTSPTMYEITTERNENLMKIGTTVGLNFRYKLMSLGAEIRTGLKDNAEFKERSIIKNSSSGAYLDRQSVYTTPGLVLDHLSIRFGVAF